MGGSKWSIAMTGIISSGHAFVDLVHHAAIRDIRRRHQHPVAGIMMEIAQMVLLVGGFYLMTTVMHVGSAPIRGEQLLYLVTGIFFFQVHVRTVSAVMQAEGPRSQIMRNRRMSPAVAIAAAGIASLYMQVIAAAIVLGTYHAAVGGIEIERPAGFAATFALSWLFGLGVGLMLVSVKGKAPAVGNLLMQAYSRANILASGQMFVANMLPTSLLAWFSWNPLFHLVDQARGFAFVNYQPWFTSLAYPAVATLAVFSAGVLLASRAGRGGVASA